MVTDFPSILEWHLLHPRNFWKSWNGTTSMSLYTDAASSVGWGAYWCSRWIQARWSSSEDKMNIVWKELFAITAAVNTWGHHWACKKVLFHCDNQTVVDIWQTGTTKSADIMALVRMLYFCAAKYNINVIITHIAGC